MTKMSVRRKLATIVLVAFAVGGCSGSGSGTAGSGSVELDASRIFKGNLTLTGTILLPSGSGGGKSIQLTATGGPADVTQRGSYVALAGTTPGESVPYAIVGLVAGEYTVRARVDQDGDGSVATSGDLDGHSGGTLEAPVLDFGAAKKVTVGASGAAGVDFGLARVP